MAQQPNILSPREPLTQPELDRSGKPNGKSTVTRSWWRFFDSLQRLSGQLLNPVVIAPNSIITPGDINSGSTVTIADSPAGTVLGNSSNVAAQPTPQVVDGSLTYVDGTLAAASLPPQTLSGNSTSLVATPQPVFLGTNLSFNGSTLNASGSSSDDETWLGSIRDTRGQFDTAERNIGGLTTWLGSVRDTRGQVADVARLAGDAFTLALLAGGGGDGFSFTVSASPYLNGGLVGNGGTITSASIAATSLIGNGDTTSAVPGVLAIGPGFNTVTLPGTLSALWQGPLTQTIGQGLTVDGAQNLRLGNVANNTLLGNATGFVTNAREIALGPGLTMTPSTTIAPGTLSAGGSGGTVTQIVAGSNLTGGTITNSGTIALQNSPTIIVNASTLPMVINGNTAFSLIGIPDLLEIHGADTVIANLAIHGYGNGGNPRMVGYATGGTQASPTALASAQAMFQYSAVGYNGTVYVSGTGVNFLATEAWTGSANGTGINFNTINTGTTVSTTKMSVRNHVLIGSTTDSGTNNLQVTGGESVDTINVSSSLTVTGGTSLTATSPVLMNANTAVPAGPAGTVVQIVGADATQSRLVFDAFGATPAIVGRRAQGTEASPTAVVSGSVLFSMQGFGYGTAYVANPRARIDFTAAETWTGAAQGAMVDFQSTPTGGTLTAVAMRLQPDGALTVGTTTEVGTSKLQVRGQALIDQINLGTVTAGPLIIPGTGVPTITAPSGSMFIRTNGSVGARIYINQDGTSSWSAIALV